MMGAFFSSLVELYGQALWATWCSLKRSWVTVFALVGFGLLFVGVARIAAPLGMGGGLLLGIANAFLVGATLRLIELSLSGSRTIQPADVPESFGHYFWDVIGVGFVLWLPMMALEMGMKTNPYGQFLAAAVMVLLFILLNPVPEVIYQVRHDSPLDVFKISYEFVLEHWIEWFLPFALVMLPILLSPDGLRSFFELSGSVGRGAGLDFLQLLLLPFTLVQGWLSYLGLDSDAQWLVVIFGTPPVATATLLFRGHLFSLLRKTTRRQRMFASRMNHP
ncbi:MAG: hypothetical protein ACK4VP_00005 [Nitrospira sp.]